MRRVLDRSQITWRRLVLISAGMVVFAVCIGAWATSGSFDASLTTLSTADPHRAAWAAAAFAASLLASACAWRISFAAVGAPMRRGQACASYSMGSLVNTFAPATLGEGIRAVLFGRSLPECGNRACTAAGAAGAVAVAKALPHTLLLSAAVLVAGFPPWLLLAPASLPVIAVVAVLFLRRRAGSRLMALGQATATLFREPGFGMRVVCWVTVATAARVAAATAVAASLGIGNPLDAGLLVAAALILAGALPITPGSIGMTSGAVSLALAQHGIPMPTALAAGVLFHALESAVGVSVGLIAAPFVVRPGIIPRRVGHVAFVGAAAMTAAMLGASLLTYLPLSGV
ncbi:MAG TPA: lysylphosphatidylglycerol synthase domain-containing protein [Gaiellaceae bacterium]|nr:lysylphosphatidylglycerol synthase domain-containing protein [Gaiellaceae bacterium]